MALFELTELASYLQRDLDTATATLARDLATGLVVDVTGVLERTTATMTLPIDVEDSVIRLPSCVVVAVTAVAIDGNPLDASSWVWEQPHPRVRLLSRSWASADWPTADVTASIGYAAGKVPQVAKAVALSAAGRIYDNPTGLRAESVDDYSSTRAGSDDDLAGITLTAAELAALARLSPSAYVTRSR